MAVTPPKEKPIDPEIVIRRDKWYLGIRSQSNPLGMIHEIYVAMKALNYEWKTVNPYYIRARLRRSNNDKEKDKDKNQTPSNPKDIKLAIQLYQIGYHHYVMDFKCVDEEGDGSGAAPRSEAFSYNILEFFEMCAALLKELIKKT